MGSWSVRTWRTGGPGGGEAQAVDLFLVSFMVVIAALVVGAVTVAGTVVSRRPAGMGLLDVPPFAFVAGQRDRTGPDPPACWRGTVFLLYVDHHYGRLVFGGNVGVMGEIGWSVLQPQTYVYGIAVLGLLAEVFPVVGKVRQPMRPVIIGAAGLAGAAAIGGAMQGMPTLDLDGVTPIQGIGQLVLYGITACRCPCCRSSWSSGLGGLALKGRRPALNVPFEFAVSADARWVWSARWSAC